MYLHPFSKGTRGYAPPNESIKREKRIQNTEYKNLRIQHRSYAMGVLKMMSKRHEGTAGPGREPQSAQKFCSKFWLTHNYTGTEHIPGKQVSQKELKRYFSSCPPEKKKLINIDHVTIC